METKKICVIGKTGNGKSTLLNTILQKSAFRTKSSYQRITVECSKEQGLWLGKEFPIDCIDTPGFADVNPETNDFIQQITLQNLLNFIKLCSNGIHAFLICFNIKSVIFDDFYKGLLRLLTIFFGKEYFHHMIIIFTFCDENQRETEETKKLIQEFEECFNVKVDAYYTSKDSFEQLKILGEKIKEMKIFDCEVFKDLRMLQNDPNKTNLDLDSYIEDKFGNSLVQNKDCSIL